MLARIVYAGKCEVRLAPGRTPEAKSHRPDLSTALIVALQAWLHRTGLNMRGNIGLPRQLSLLIESSAPAVQNLQS